MQTQPITARPLEAVIKRNLDGTTSVIYPDSDDENEIEPVMKEETDVVKGASVSCLAEG